MKGIIENLKAGKSYKFAGVPNPSTVAGFDMKWVVSANGVEQVVSYEESDLLQSFVDRGIKAIDVEGSEYTSARQAAKSGNQYALLINETLKLN